MENQQDFRLVAFSFGQRLWAIATDCDIIHGHPSSLKACCKLLHHSWTCICIIQAPISSQEAYTRTHHEPSSSLSWRHRQKGWCWKHDLKTSRDSTIKVRCRWDSWSLSTPWLLSVSRTGRRNLLRSAHGLDSMESSLFFQVSRHVARCQAPSVANAWDGRIEVTNTRRLPLVFLPSIFFIPWHLLH